MNKDIGKMIKVILLKNNMTQADLMRKLNKAGYSIPKTHLSEVILGKSSSETIISGIEEVLELKKRIFIAVKR